MTLWFEAFVFGLALVAFTLGASNIIIGFIHQPIEGTSGMREKVEYGFFGVSGLIVCAVLSYALSTM
jgi:hypothetical protein